MTKVYTLLILTLVSFSCLAQVEGTWKIAPEANSLAVGPAMGDFSWYSISDDEVNQRACYYNDLYVFRADGTFINMQGNETWLEEWQSGGDAMCGAPVAPHDGSNDATWSYNATNRTVTITGVGAYIGLPKVHNAGEIDNPANAVSSITYPANIQGDRMVIDINFGGIGVWHFVLVKVTGTTSVTEITEEAFSFSPNPATSEIYVNSENPIDAFTIRDITGKVMIERRNILLNENIDVSTFDQGLYLLESRSGDQITVKKLMIK
jgi:hypothetical protein